MIWKPLARQVWKLAWPAITHMLLVTLVLVVGRVMIGRYSATALASMQISGTLTWTIYAVFTAFSSGTLAIVARSIGAGDRATARRAARASIALAFTVGLVVTTALLIADGALLRALFPKAKPEILADASAYLVIVLPALPLAFVEAVAAAALQGAGDTRTPLIVAAAGNVVNVALSAALIFGKLGFPELGIRGAAIGTAATMSIEGALLVLAVHRGRALRAPDGGDPQALARVVRVAAPTILEKIFYHGGYLAFVAILGTLGATAMAANQALTSIEAICFLSADGLGVAAGAVVAQRLGAKQYDEAARGGWIAAAMAVAMLTAFGLVFVIAPRALMSVFSTDPDILHDGARTLYVAALAQPFMAFATVMAMSLRGAGDTRSVLGITIFAAAFVRVAATYFFAVHLKLGLVGVWLGSTADWVVRSVLLGATYMRGRWRRLVV